jgi:hypothetical protein
MKYGNIQARYHGFHPSEYTKSQVDSTLQEIYDESPDGACLRADFSQVGNLLKGIIEVQSSAGAFFASAVGGGLNQVTDRLLDQMRRRLKRWKMKRFSEENTKNKEEGYGTSVA